MSNTTQKMAEAKTFDMPNCSWDFVVTTLGDNELKRLACCYMCLTNTPSVDWTKACAIFGSASVESLKKTVRNSLVKLATAVEAAGDEAPEVSPMKAEEPTKKKGGRPPKRKVSDGESSGSPVAEAAAKRPRGRPPKAKPAFLKIEDADAEGSVISPPLTPPDESSSKTVQTKKPVVDANGTRGKKVKQSAEPAEVGVDVDVVV